MKNNFLRILFQAIFCFCLIFGVMGCRKRPSGVLSENKMVSLLADMEIAEAYANTQMSASSKEKLEMGQRVLEAHGVTNEQLDTTLAWYGRNMDEYSSLYDKVDAEIMKRKEKYIDTGGIAQMEADNLWPYSPHLILSPLSGRESFVFQLPNIQAERGSEVELTFSLPNTTAFKGTLGVDYTDGHGETSSSNFSSKHHVRMLLQTDSAKDISRIFGILEIKDKIDENLYIDSIRLSVLPFDSLAYKNNKRNQRIYGKMLPQPKPEIPEITEPQDSIVSPADSISALAAEPTEEKISGAESPKTEMNKPKTISRKPEEHLKKRSP